MQKFKFKLESVLKHRTVLEEQAMLSFAAAQNELAACLARATALRMEFQQLVKKRPELFDVEEITLREGHLDSLLNMIEQQERIREGLEARLDDERVKLLKSRQERQTVTRLREIRYAEHKRESDRIEQEAIDELATLRYVKRET
jgi:flagellar export protein FliJ